MKLFVIFAILYWLGAISCAPPHGITPKLSEPLPPPQIESLLSIPPKKDTLHALDTLEKKAQKGTCRAGWLRVQYLFDLFDALRVLPYKKDVEQLGLLTLWKGLRLPGPPARGRHATVEVVHRFAEEIERLAPRCSSEYPLADLKTLLHIDKAPRQTEKQATLVAVAYKKIARSDSPLAANSQLRLIDWCAEAFHLAAGEIPPLKHHHLLQCLFPLFDANPAPYFDKDPEKRPFDPPWTLLRKKLFQELENLKTSRLKAVADALERKYKNFFNLATSALPTALNLAVYSLVQSTAGVPWERTPIILVTEKGFIIGSQAIFDSNTAALEEAIVRHLHNDRRGIVTVAAVADSAAIRILDIARAARRAGASSLHLAVKRKIASRSPASDAQAMVFGGGPIFRCEGIPFSLRLLPSTTPLISTRDKPRGQGFDPMSAPNNLTVLVKQNAVEITSKDGFIPSVPLAGLPLLLKKLHRAYPLDRSILLAIDKQATVADIIHASEFLRRGTPPIFSGFALVQGSNIRSPKVSDLTPLIESISSVKLTIEPLSNNMNVPLWTCFVEMAWPLLKKEKPLPFGTLKIRIAKNNAKVVSGSFSAPRGFKRCISKRLHSFSADRHKTIGVTLSDVH